MLIFDKFKKWWKDILKVNLNLEKKTGKLIWGIMFFIILALILTIDFIPNQINLQAGEVSKVDIMAPRTVTFIDQQKTDELRKMAAESAPRVYEEDTNVNNNIIENIKTIFNTVNYIKGQNEGEQNNLNLEKLIIQLQKEKGILLSSDIIKVLVQASNEDLDKIQTETIKIMDKQLEQHILPGDVPKVQDTMEQEVQELDFKKDYRQAIIQILNTNIKPNMILNEKETIKKQKDARNQVEPIKRTVRQGEMIVRKGDIVTADDIIVLEALGLQKGRIDYFSIIGIILVILILIITIAYYFREYEESFWQCNKKLLLLELLVILIFVLAKIISIFQGSYLMYLVPVAAASILATVLIGTDIAVIMTIGLSLLVALIFNNSYNVALASFIGGLVGIFSVTRVSQRSDLVRAGFNVSGVLLVLIFAMNLLQPATTSNWVNVLQTVGMGVLNGVLVAILANGLLPYLENGFGLTSSVKLLELSNPSQPLLKRLLVEAPGTYHHSVIVGNLAETAADNIGADSLLARVGAYYHDIGKLKRPYFFTDNQFGGDNPHDKISANLSSLIIKAHVKDGVELAREYKLPEDVIDIIKQHHGTNLISYFFQQAQEDDPHGSVEESEFRYDGPRPRSKEAVLIMMADIVEAAVRSKNFDKNDRNRIEVLTRDLIRKKLIENQLDESDLTLKELDVITESFVKVLTGIYHHRIEYPENLIKEMKRADKSD